MFPTRKRVGYRYFVMLGIVILCGLPGSGKTSFCESLGSTCPGSIQLIHYSFDKKLLEKSDDFDPIQWKAVRREAFGNLKHLIQEYKVQQQDSPKHQIIILDDNMFYRSMRKPYFKLAEQHGLSYVEVYFKVPSVDFALEQNNQRRNTNSYVPPASIIKMHQAIEPPIQTANFPVYTIQVHPTFDPIVLAQQREEFWKKVQCAIESPLQVQSPKVDRIEDIQSNENFRHQFDLKVRQFIHQVIKQQQQENPDKACTVRLAACLQQLKFKLCQRFKESSTIPISLEFLTRSNQIIDADLRRYIDNFYSLVLGFMQQFKSQE